MYTKQHYIELLAREANKKYPTAATSRQIFMKGATAALDQCILDINKLETWKKQAIEALNPLFDYADEEFQLKDGESKTGLILQRCKDCEALKEKYDNILATETGHTDSTENVWQSGYAAGHAAAMEKYKAATYKNKEIIKNVKTLLSEIECNYLENEGKELMCTVFKLLKF